MLNHKKISNIIKSKYYIIYNKHDYINKYAIAKKITYIELFSNHNIFSCIIYYFNNKKMNTKTVILNIIQKK